MSDDGWPDAETLRAWYDEGRTVADIADRIDKPRPLVQGVVGFLGLGGNRQALTEAEKFKAAEQYRTTDDTIRDVASDYGVSFSSMKRYFQDMGVDTGYTQMSAAQRREAAERYRATNDTLSEIAEDYGVHPTTLSKQLERAGLKTKDLRKSDRYDWPGLETLEAWRDDGLTYAEIAERVPGKPTPEAVIQRLRRARVASE